MTRLLQGALLLLGCPPRESRHLESSVAVAVVQSAARTRPDVQRFLMDHGVDPEERPLELTRTGGEFRDRLNMGEYDGGHSNG